MLSFVPSWLPVPPCILGCFFPSVGTDGGGVLAAGRQHVALAIVLTRGTVPKRFFAGESSAGFRAPRRDAAAGAVLCGASGPAPQGPGLSPVADARTGGCARGWASARRTRDRFDARNGSETFFCRGVIRGISRTSARCRCWRRALRCVGPCSLFRSFLTNRRARCVSALVHGGLATPWKAETVLGC